MANANVSRLGQVNEAGDVEALFLKVFAGEVITAFHEVNVSEDKHMIRTITSGKSAQFPAIGRVTAGYHTPGTEILGQDIKHAERIITIDDLLISDVFIDVLDEAMNHYDVRGPYSNEVGLALSEQFDKHVLQQGYLAAAGTATITGLDGGTQITDADANTNGSSLAGAMFDVAQNFDEKKIPSDPRFMFMAPAQYYLLVQTTDTINRDWGGQGVYSEGKIFRVAGINIIKTNNLANGSNINSAPGHGDGDSRHAVDATNYVALAWHPSAVGTTKLIGLGLEMVYEMRRQGTLMVAKYAVGHGILRPESSALIKTA